jgi:hypothetical protein
MSAPIEIVSIISIKPGNIDRVYQPALLSPVSISPYDLNKQLTCLPKKVIQELTPFTEHVEASEPAVLRYQMYRQINATIGTENLVFIEM